MIQDVAAKRYAEAAHLIARGDGTADAWASGLEALASLMANEEAQAFLQNSRVPADQKSQLLENALKGADPLVVNLARLLLRRNKMGLAPQIAQAFRELIDEDRGIMHATVTTAVPLSADELRALTDKLGGMVGGSVVVEPRVDESIIGGLVVRMGDRLIDGSTRSSLQALKRRLAGEAR